MSELPTAEQLPQPLRTHEQWVCWKTEEREGKETKVPVDPSSGRYASTTDPSTWATFEQAREHTLGDADVAGVGFVFSDDDPFVGVDLDTCREEDGRSPEWALDIIEQLDSYTEVSPSGTGYHVIVTGQLPAGANRRGDIECYETARYFTVTGDSIHDPPRDVAERTAALAAVHAEYVAEVSADEGTVDTQPPIGQERSGGGLDDETLVQKARSAANGEKFDRLWNGSTSGYDSHSEADMALCFHLAFWTGGDTAQIDRLFRQSGLLREKWDEVHFADGSTYGEKTVERAVARVNEFYEPPSGRQDPPEKTDTTAPSATDPAASRSSRTGPSSDRREHRLLGIIDQLEERVKTLEAENEELRAELEGEHKRREEQQPDTDREASEQGTLWTRMTARLGSSRRR